MSKTKAEKQGNSREAEEPETEDTDNNSTKDDDDTGPSLLQRISGDRLL
jgi:hypothetical protein